jgi:hypothetical protein
VQLREAEFLGPVDDDRIGVRVVDAGFDDRRAQEEIHALLREVAHHALQIALLHLAVADDDARFRQQLGEPVAHVLDRVDLVVQEINLAATLEFAQQRFPDDAVGEAADEGLDRQALLRRSGDDRKVTQTFERHGERARDRRRGQGEHVHFRTQRFQGLFLADTKAMFLIDHHQSEDG